MPKKATAAIKQVSPQYPDERRYELSYGDNHTVVISWNPLDSLCLFGASDDVVILYPEQAKLLRRLLNSLLKESRRSKP